jgi:hypothetical protein
MTTKLALLQAATKEPTRVPLALPKFQQSFRMVSSSNQASTSSTEAAHNPPHNHSHLAIC